MGANKRRVLEVRQTHLGARDSMQQTFLGVRDVDQRVQHHPIFPHNSGIEGPTVASNSGVDFGRDAGQGRHKPNSMDTPVIWIRRAGTAVLALCVALLVAWIVNGVSSDTHAPRWAKIDEFHVIWMPEQNVVRNSIRLETYEDCADIAIEKSMRPLVDGQVQTDAKAIVLEGGLRDKIMNGFHKGSKGYIFDDARPKDNVKINPGTYWITLSVGCINDGFTRRTELISAPLNVQAMDIP